MTVVAQPNGFTAAADADNELLRKIFTYSNDAIFVLDAQRDKILDANPAACRMLGYSHEELLSLPISAIHPEEMPRLLAFASSVMEQGHGWTSELSCRTKDACELASEISASVTRIGSKDCIVSFVRDVSERKRAQEALKQYSADLERLVEERTVNLSRSEERHRLLLEVTNALINNLGRASLFNSLVAMLRGHIRFDAAVVCLDDEDAGVCRIFGLDRSSTSQYGFGQGTAFPRENTHIGWVITNEKPLLRRDLEKDRQFPIEDRLLAQGVRSYVIVPLKARERVLGTLNLGSRTVNAYTEADASFLEEIAGQLSLALQNMLAFEEIADLKARLEQENLYLQEEIRTEGSFADIVGQSKAIKSVMKAVQTVASTDATVLLLGETGTGKELFARAIHMFSHRKERALVKVNCAALPSGLIESELFGHEKGAFTGALLRKVGRFELADGGTIFLDEIGDLPLDLQAKLLRVLQEGEFERLGSGHTIHVKVRVMAATNRDLQLAVEEGNFRADLFYRLNVFPIEIPPLRERKEDIPLLVNYLVEKHGKRLGRRLKSVPQKVMDTLLNYAWPGNVRELENVIERSVITSAGSQLELSAGFSKTAATPTNLEQPLMLQDVERQHILQTLERSAWRVSGKKGAAELLGLNPTTLEARMKKLGIQRKP